MYVVCFSGGKDSVACLLALLEWDVPKDKIELWRHAMGVMLSTEDDWELPAGAFGESCGPT